MVTGRSIGGLARRALWYGSRPTEAARALVHRTVSTSARHRGHYERDGRLTLLTVDFDLTDHVLRLARSFRRHVDATGPIVVVQNGPRSNSRRLRDEGIEVRGFNRNIGHGTGLDWGLRYVQTEYVLVCDPDSFILDRRFRDEVMGRLLAHGVCGIVVSDEPKHQYYHPVCTALETRLWKEAKWSFEPDYASSCVPNDVGHELTRHLGGIEPDALLPRSRTGYGGAIYADSFTNTWGMSRIRIEDHHVDGHIDGRPLELSARWIAEWVAWVDRVAAGADDASGFPDW